MTTRSSFRFLSLFPFAGAICVFLFPAFAASLYAQRLPLNIRPMHYTLTLTPNLQTARFTGVETIDITLAAPSKTITLNATDIEFQSVKIAAAGKEQTASVSLDTEKQQATFTFAEALPAGQATLAITYSGILGNNLRGFYLSKTSQRNYAVTQFESTDARRAFPSFDEPALKATYDVSLVVDTGDTAISNGAIVSDTPGPAAGKHTLRFATTPKMSTYLVAFLVGDFKCSTGESDGVAIRVCATPDKVALTPFALNVAEWMLHYYNSYFDIPYPLKKLDLIALPDFEAGAMENFGAITYRETDLLVDEKSSSLHSRVNVAIVVAHEMAHQWFGDLVTMQWWNNLWLNEGFATWMENKAVAKMHPEWNIDQTVAGNRETTLNLDAQPTTRAIRADVNTPEEIEQLFDGISYGKAGAVITSIENYVGEESFRQGVQKYLKAHLYANATAEDFWNAQTAVSGKPVNTVMQSLVAQQGVPLLTFGKAAQGKIPVTQQRFYLSPGIHATATQKWALPVCFKSTTGQECQVLTPCANTLKYPPAKIFFANASAAGYYRTSYTAADYAALVAGVESSLTPAERISLLGDEWARVRANLASAGDYLDLIAAIKNDSSTGVLDQALDVDPISANASQPLEAFPAIYFNIASTSQQKNALSAWVKTTFATRYATLGSPSPSDTDETREQRAMLFYLLGYYGNDASIQAKAREIAQQFIADPTAVEATLGKVAVTLTASHGDTAFFEQLQKIYENSKNPELQEFALITLAQFQDPALATRAFDYAASGKVRNQDAGRLFTRAFANGTTRDLAWQYIQNNWDKVQAQFTVSMGIKIVAATGNFCSTQERDTVKNFFATHKVDATDSALRHALEHIDGCTQLRILQEPKLAQWLAKK
jgi:aminopeptidase N